MTDIETAIIFYVAAGLLYLAWRQSKATASDRKEVKDKLEAVYDNPLPPSVIATVLSVMFVFGAFFAVSVWPWFAWKLLVKNSSGGK